MEEKNIGITQLEVYPNPFNQDLSIIYELKENSNVTLSVYDLVGKTVKILVNEHQQKGVKHLKWNGEDDLENKIKNGIYIITLKTEKCVINKKVFYHK